MELIWNGIGMQGLSPCVSIIVPVYNDESLLPGCLDSLLVQTLDDFEIVLIDDGSMDGTAELADGYASRDSRVRVIHQENGGISNARNRGVGEAQGEDITFVDADDWVEPTYLAYLYQVRRETGCPLTACNHVIEAGGQAYPRFPVGKAMEGLGLRQAMENVLYHRPPDISPWGKLYPAKLLREITYPPGKIFEDTDAIGEILTKAGGIGMGYTPQYHYRYGESTISKTVKASELEDFMDAVEHLTESALALDPGLERACVRRRVHGALSTKRLMVRDEPAPDYTRANRVIRRGALTVLADPNAPGRDKLGILAALMGDKAYHAFWRAYRRVRKTY